ncbi:MAG: hypothetical protein F4X66_06920 [Chloroflexi bacterium]|nr:hypothetical protein [Chloroflexota bacterium]MYE40000.1 hypothetical protein [Chloroflexota bacterium]
MTFPEIADWLTVLSVGFLVGSAAWRKLAAVYASWPGEKQAFFQLAGFGVLVFVNLLMVAYTYLLPVILRNL